MNYKPTRIITVFALGLCTMVNAQKTDATAPLHLTQPDYPTPYVIPQKENIKAVLDRVYNFLDKNSASKIVDANTKAVITDYKKSNQDIIFEPGAFRLTSYEWGVTYAGMLLAANATGEKYFADYSNKRIQLITDIAANYKEKNIKDVDMVKTLHPEALDFAGALCAAFIKAKKEGLKANIDPLVNNYIDFISNKQFRLKDGTLARNRPQDNTLWLDDMFMSVPALAQMGSYTGDVKYFDDAVKQVDQFSERMFNSQKGVYMHGWVESMQVHPQFHWARANGWALMTMVELLEVLPKNHPGYPQVLSQLQKHIAGLMQYQDGTGFWHQLLDRNDSYLETSATAIYAYSIARAINRGYVNKMTYAPAVLLAWNAVASKVNDKGQVEGTCVGTGMAFDPAFYYHRPVNVFAAHGYGPVLLAGAEVILLLKESQFEINDSSIQLKIPGKNNQVK
ncbi:family 88 glycosyl hydrolase [Flavobacterium aquidurense]|jgi:unsaturated rhamnogalacturonyl hydrolase|uniref:glycoside hydrolase family 88/105 protein n=1 Tax=Flavobacterium aquidurense TaxID=362413 RepID=UPI00090F7F48|nr:glycoside hydrolase family 88 protein [Flavobacterium aquidurense]OXA71737.1 family 88 glycosyl hydrolase [Flavobacterium aquidurense]SHH21010.1 Rhamnogalacturonyl hydrolase YesR [Flavobacterium frigidimaris]